MRKKITNNIPLKIISLLIGFLVWLIVVNIDNPIISRSFTIQNIEILNEAYIDDVLEDAGKVALRNAESPTVRVTITGERKNVNGITSGDIHLTADMQQALSLNTDPVMIPIVASCDKNGVASITVSPPNLSVKLEDKATSTFPVTVNNGDSRPGKGYEIGTQSVEPDSILITGPYSLVKIIDKVNVTTSAVNGATDDVTESGTVEVIDKNGEILSQIAMKNLRFDNEGRVTVTTHLWKTRSDISLDVAVAGMPAEGYMVDEVTTVPDTISVAGTDEALEHLSQLGNVIRIEDASVDVSGASDDVETKIDITQYLPEDIRLTSGSSNEVSVTVTVLPDGGRSYSIPTSSIRVLNKEEDMQAFFEVDRIEVRLKAADENGLDSFHEEDLEATIDLTGKEEGTYELPVDIQLPDGITLLNEVSTEVTVSKVIIQEESVE